MEFSIQDYEAASSSERKVMSKKILKLLADLKKENAELKEDISRKEDKVNEAIKKSICKKKLFNESLKQQNESQRSEIKERITELKELLKKADEESSMKEKEKEELRAKIKEIKFKNDNLQIEKAIMEKELSSHLEEIDNIAKEKEQLKELIENRTIKLKENEKKKMDKKVKLEEAKKELKMVQESVRVAKGTAEELKEELALLTSNLMSLQSNESNMMDVEPSLFNEVDVNRKDLVEKYKVLKEKCIDLKRTLKMKSKVAEELEEFQFKFECLLEDKKKAEEENDLEYLESLKKRIRDLEFLNTALGKRPEIPEVEIIDENNFSIDRITKLVNISKAECAQFKAEVDKLKFGMGLRNTNDNTDDLNEVVKSREERILKLKTEIAQFTTECESNYSSSSKFSGSPPYYCKQCNETCEASKK